MYKWYVCWLMGIFFCLSCTEKQKNDSAFAPDLLNEAKESVRYSQFVDSLEYLPLETSDKCLIGKIKDVYIGKECVFVFDDRMQTVWIFDRKGNYLGEIRKSGNGPGEYVNAQQFEVDEANRQIVLLDIWTNKLLHYDWEGGLLKEVPLEVRAMDFKPLPSGGYVVSLAGSDTDAAGIYQVDASGKVVRQLVKRDERSSIYTQLSWELCSVGDNVCFMSPIFENDVYSFDGEELVLRYAFDMQPPLTHHYGKDDTFQHMEDFSRTQYIESDGWIYAAYWSSVYDLRCFLFSKKEQRYWIGKSLVNDLDGVNANGRTSATQGNTFTFWYIPERAEEENPVLQIMHLKS